MRNIILILIFLCFHSLSSQVIDPLATDDMINQNKWVDSIYKNLSLDEKIGQLFFVQATSKKTNNSEKIINDIKDFKIGGLIFSTSLNK